MRCDRCGYIFNQDAEKLIEPDIWWSDEHNMQICWTCNDELTEEKLNKEEGEEA